MRTQAIREVLLMIVIWLFIMSHFLIRYTNYSFWIIIMMFFISHILIKRNE